MAFQPTRGLVKLKGQITRMNERSVKDDFDNERCKKISFALKTSEVNEVPVQIFGYKNDKVYYSEKSPKGEKSKIVSVDWADRYEAPSEGAQLIGTHIKAEGQEEITILTSYEAIDKVYESFKNGDWVFIQGSTSPNSYESNGETRTTMNIEIDKIYASKEDKSFGDEGYEEMATFKQKGVFLGAEKVKNEETKETEVHVDLRIIQDKEGKFTDFTYVVPAKTDSSKKLANGLLKKVKAYDEVVLMGYVRNEAIVEEVELDEEDDWGGETVAGFGTAVTSYRRVYEVVGFDTAYWKENKEKYKESDFEPDDFDSSDAIDFGDDDDDDF
ncbi:hypothetical protein EVJ32_04720 [Exiguobacterium sp. SH5S4]|uniref:hypothetical protein n=1 Tax=Exiguobacterium sp. SH5S4 TaxID=2510961 RepID=UPI00103A56A6|nr:hypothetical protein [Exiguobacterium sp. SH5S4]TCI26681.1 hypothetical protein EVJ32_04720 [Exiguobacterium sp. SH5S4]